jgi:cyclophilin family peptidyl-prolyl cis-trans isomerase
MKKIISLLCIATLTTCINVNAQQSAKATAAPAKTNERIVAITTEYGTMKIKLYNQTPKHRDNFIKLATSGFYNGTLFHRVIKTFMIQGGDPESKNAPAEKMLGNGSNGSTVPAEFNDNLIHKKGALAAARTENPEKASSDCQFYIVQGKPVTDEELNAIETRSGKKYTPEQRKIYTTIGGTPFLDHNYTVYGEVIEGLDVIDKIASAATKPGDRPVKDVKMTVKVIQ